MSTSKFFRDYKKLHEAVGRVQFVVCENLRVLIYPKLHERKHLITSWYNVIYKWQFLSRFSILRDKMKRQATSTLLDENLTCEFKRNI